MYEATPMEMAAQFATIDRARFTADPSRWRRRNAGLIAISPAASL